MKKSTKAISLLCSLFISGFAMAQTQTIQSQISTSSDDAEERGANATSGTGTMDLTSSDLELVKDGNDGDQYVGMRFNNISIPQGALISNAYIQFTVDEDDASAGTVIFKAEDTDNSTTFSSSAFNISSRPTMADSVVWSNIPYWNTVGAAGADQQTPDLSAIIQGVVNRAGWASGNSLNIIAHGTGERVAESYDGSSGSAAVLVIEFTSPVSATFSILNTDDDAEQNVANGNMYRTSSDLEITTDGSSEQIIGMRFDQVGIPAGAQVIDAYIQFTVDEVTTSGNVDAIIAIEDQPNPLAISGFDYDLQNRSIYFGDTTIWNVPGFSTINNATANERTPNLSNLLNRVVSKPTWASGNAVLFLMADPSLLNIPGYSGNTGKRTAQSRNKSASRSPKLVVSYIPPATYQNGVFPIAKGSSWKYDDSGNSLDGTNWTALAYNDSTWAYGNGVLGYGNGNATTTLDFGGNASAKHPTYYLRNTFEVADPSLYDSLVFNVMRDDGVVVYVNGTEAFRMNMPAGNINYNTLASNTVGGADETKYFQFKTGNLLQSGTNVIAVELHQATINSSDLSFDMEVGFELPPLSAATYPLAKLSDWHYLDNGSDLGATNWNDTTFNDDNWDWGQGPLGYGDAMNTTISYGPDANNKIITYYFRRDMDIDLASLPDSVEFGLRRDDGAVVYVNGVEVFRSNMPAGNIDYLTHSASIVSGSSESSYYSYLLPKTIFVDGLNTVAVEIHNRDGSSSDLGFDMYIDDAPVVNPPALGCANGNGNHIGCFTSIAPTSQTSNLLIPETSHRFQLIFKQGEAYTDGNGNVPGNHDFTGYIPTNGSSELGHLGINHETTPGAVSMLDLHYDPTSHLWTVDSSKKVDFYTNDIVTTARNCSGGITPWGTFVTAEETTNNGDANNDGYQDVGWLVEVDPITAEVMDYDNDGKKDKLWKMGRMSHENVVVSPDSTTAYYGEDGGTHCVYKYVMDTPGNLSSGSVYVLKLDNPLVGNDPTGTTATWVPVPNATKSDCNNMRNIAASLGGTNFSGVEDVEISPLDGKIYFTAKGRNRVYRFTDGASVTNFETFVGGTSYILNTEDGVFTEPWGSGNDNLTFDDQGNLWVLQDGGRNYIWLVRPDHTQSTPKVELFASMPAGSEPTGLTFSPDHRFGFVSIQHPSGSNAPQQDATGNNVTFNRSATIVFSREAHLGPQPCPNPMNTTLKPDGLKSFWGATDNHTFYFGLTQWKRIKANVKGGVGPYTYTWSKSGSGQLKPTGNPARIALFEPTGPVSVYVTIDDAGTGCSTTDTIEIAFDDSYFCGSTSPRMVWNLNICENGVSKCVSWNTAKTLIKNGNATLGDCGNATKTSLVETKLFPNPTSSEATLAYYAHEDANGTIEVVDMNGRVLQVQNVKVKQGTQQFNINLSDMPNGMYFVRMVTDTDVYTERLQLLK